MEEGLDQRRSCRTGSSKSQRKDKIIMSKLTDTLKAALAKKQGKHHMENDDGATVEKKAKKTAPPVGAGKPMKKAAGRGR